MVRHSLDLNWLWHRVVAIALIGPLAWDPAYAVGVALKRKKKKERERIWNPGVPVVAQRK